MTTTMKFGKYKGRPITEVDLKYLLWCRDNLPHCPTSILDELTRRGQTTLTSRQAAKRARVEHKARKQRAKAAEKLDRFAHGVNLPNPDFDRLREEYAKAGGDLTACPFDTDDYTYTAPGFVGRKEQATVSKQPASGTCIPECRRSAPSIAPTARLILLIERLGRPPPDGYQDIAGEKA